ncbi:bile acid:sodium symporter [Zobellia sp. OII3]|uniref:bile acid:sodium symporter n=1 Tax=Zobellia sp. OII3 TaxID=2034520 RepID=UPI002936E03F|nr:bile acid:sodium symporter [Zobellia sp. OII3]
MAKGNIPAAIFNASISGIIGVLLTPLWMGLFVKNAQTEFDFADIYLQLIVQIILPVLLGVVLQRLWGEYAQKYGKQLTLFDKSVILLIIYKSFARSFDYNIFNAISFLDLLIVFIAVLALFVILYVLTGFLAKKLKFNTEDQITAQFCGTKKSLVHGTVFAKIIFGNAATIGIILLPLMLFHALQLLVISVLASKMGDKNQAIKDGSPSS